MEHDTAGDPVSGIKWTRRTTEKVAEELCSAGIEVCPNTVAKLLKGLGYRLRVNAKKLNRQKDPGRDAQFAYIAAKREAFAKAGLPVVSVDAKHREMVGELKNPGTTWEKEPGPTGRAAEPGSTASSTGSPTPTASASLSATTRAAPRSTTPLLSTGHFRRSARTGQAGRSPTTRPSSTTSARPAPRRGSGSTPTSSRPTTQPASRSATKT
jgi:hypothetical protein